MFSGLSDYFKKILPKRLFYRALLIVAIPVLVLQLVITIVFFDSLWIKTNKGMTRTLVNEISTFIEAYASEQENKQELLDLFSIFLDLNIEFTDNEKLNNAINEIKSNNVKVIIGPITNDEFEIAKKHNDLIFISPSNINSKLSKNIISIGISLESQLLALVNFIKKQKKN